MSITCLLSIFCAETTVLNHNIFQKWLKTKDEVIFGFVHSAACWIKCSPLDTGHRHSEAHWT